MAEIVPFQDIVRARRRHEQRLVAERCVEIIELNLRLSLELFDAADSRERAIHARRVRHLGELLEYAVRCL
ncbi:MAG: hypothetical protein HY270_23425 [Deltaproteobacteria bacterium]|nr:hypothetical protein [Deltaproteobacteria bacterium]